MERQPSIDGHRKKRLPTTGGPSLYLKKKWLKEAVGVLNFSKKSKNFVVLCTKCQLNFHHGKLTLKCFFSANKIEQAMISLQRMADERFFRD